MCTVHCTQNDIGTALSCSAQSTETLRATSHLLHFLHAEQGSFLQGFFADTANMDADQRGKFLEEPPQGAPDIDAAHEVSLYAWTWVLDSRSGRLPEALDGVSASVNAQGEADPDA